MSSMGDLLIRAAEAATNDIMENILDDAWVYIAEEVERAYRTKYLEGFAKRLGLDCSYDLLMPYGDGSDEDYCLSELLEETKEEMLELSNRLDFYPWAIAEVKDIIKGLKSKNYIREIYNEISVILLEAW